MDRNNFLEILNCTSGINSEYDSALLPDVKSTPANTENLETVFLPNTENPQESQNKENKYESRQSYQLFLRKAKKIQWMSDKKSIVDESSQKITEFFPGNKNVKLIGIMTGNRREGLWKEFGKNGKLLKETNYSNNLRNGLCKEWFPNGQLRVEGMYKNGNKDGFSVVYKPSGVIKTKGIYENGKLVNDSDLLNLLSEAKAH